MRSESGKDRKNSKNFQMRKAALSGTRSAQFTNELRGALSRSMIYAGNTDSKEDRREGAGSLLAKLKSRITLSRTTIEQRPYKRIVHKKKKD